MFARVFDWFQGKYCSDRQSLCEVRQLRDSSTREHYKTQVNVDLLFVETLIYKEIF